MSQESIERLSEIWSAWGFTRYPQVAKLSDFLEPLEAEAHSKAGSHLDLRAVQCLLLDPEHVQAAHRPALRDATRCLPAEWRVGSEVDIAFVQAMLLAVRPKAPALAELMVAGRSAQRGREKQKPRLDAWLNSGRWEGVRHAGGSTRAPDFAVRSSPSFPKVDGAVAYLSMNTRQALLYPAIAPPLIDALSELNSAINEEFGKPDKAPWGEVEASITVLLQGTTLNMDFPSFCGDLIAIIEYLLRRLHAFSGSATLEPSLGKLKELRNESSKFSAYGRDLIHLLVGLKTEILRIHHVRETQSWQDEYRQWAEAVTTQAQSQMLASAEQKLLWWGQSRYCSPLLLPYRALRADPIATVWWAALEVAELGKPLEFAPLSAFLVNTLEKLGLDVNEKKSASAWLSSLAEVLKAVPSELRKHVTPKDPLKSLAEKDALGLPVTWLRLEKEGELSSAVALDLELEIDLGDLAEWLLGELLLDHRMAP